MAFFVGAVEAMERGLGDSASKQESSRKRANPLVQVSYKKKRFTARVPPESLLDARKALAEFKTRASAEDISLEALQTGFDKAVKPKKDASETCPIVASPFLRVSFLSPNPAALPVFLLAGFGTGNCTLAGDSCVEMSLPPTTHLDKHL